MSAIRLPRRPRGRMSAAGIAQYQADRAAFCKAIIEIDRSLDFKVGARGWAYILEEYGLAKGDFDLSQNLISECRKTGELPLDIVAEDDAREFVNLEMLSETTPEAEALAILEYAMTAHQHYAPISFWEFQDCYVEMLVEKIDLKSLFASICAQFHIPLANARGNSDINSRARMMRRFARWERQGKQPVLLYAGDHDPAGLRISDFLRRNLEDLSQAVGWRPDNLIIDRFGLNADFIREHNLTWIDNLETGSGARLDDPRHPDHRKAYVQEYLARYGARKVEANALVTRPQAGRELCLAAIRRYVDTGAAMAAWKSHVEREQGQVADAVRLLMMREEGSA